MSQLSPLRQILQKQEEYDKQYRQKIYDLEKQYQKDIAPYKDAFKETSEILVLDYKRNRPVVDPTTLVWEIKYTALRVEDDGLCMHSYKYLVTYSKFTTNRSEAKATNFPNIDINEQAKNANFSSVQLWEYETLKSEYVKYIDTNQFYETDKKYLKQV